jgi:hypothetical protein
MIFRFDGCCLQHGQSVSLHLLSWPTFIISFLNARL